MANNVGMKLSDLYPSLSGTEREALAKAIGSSSGYLYQMATQWRGKKPSLEMLKALSVVEQRLSIEDLVNEFTEDQSVHQDTEKDGA